MNAREARSDAAAANVPDESASETANDGLEAKRLINHLLWFFALVYIVEGLGQVAGGLISQPLTYYLKQVHGWTPVQVTAFLTLFNLPWVIKPVYGLISDFVPLFGYRRKSYLIIANVAAIAGYFWATQIDTPSVLVFALMMTAYAMAISSTLCGAVLVENGQKLHESGRFVNQQWLWANIAAMAAAIIGGQLVQHLPPSSALHAGAAIVGVTPFLVIIGTLLLIPEQKVSINLQGMKSTLDGFLASFKRRELWIIAVFMFLYYFSPGFATPLYYHMTDNLKFSQGYIGILASIASAGWVVGALLYKRFFGDLSLKNLLNVSIAFGTVSTAAYLLLSTETSAAILNFCSGFSAMLATVATLTLAADYCPPRAEGFAFATLMSIINLATTLADNVGSFLYTHLFHGNLTPLVLVSAAFTAIAFVLVPLLRLGDKRQGDPAASLG
ncbi:MAG: MFS transporter [Xanthobacteraceae bacterium]